MHHLICLEHRTALELDLVGSLQVTVGYGNKMVPSFTFHFAHRGANLMGLDLFSALGFSLVDTKGAAILTVSTPWQQKWPSLFEGLGCLSAFANQPLPNPAIKPVIQPLRRIPLALHDGVSAELKQLLDIGIIDVSPYPDAAINILSSDGAPNEMLGAPWDEPVKSPGNRTGRSLREE